MPPKRKTRRPSKATSTPAYNANEDTPASNEPLSEADHVDEISPPDDWTDEQEAALFKAMIRWKPVGVHKHFRMIALAQYLQNHGHIASEEEHLRIPAIWKKLGKLYNLEALNERENTFSHRGSPDSGENDEPYCPFILPKEDFGQMVFDRRLAPEGSTSPPGATPPPSASSTSAAVTRRASTVEDTEGDCLSLEYVEEKILQVHTSDPRSSPASARGTRSTRSTRGTRSTRRSQLHEVSGLTEQRGDNRALLDDGSVDTVMKERANVSEDPEDAEQSVHEEATKSTNTRSTRRKSGRRR
ncbi:MAG: hypothetical protein Q9220_003723 [cf. Caloplaca sp. 1 TL-2023]